MKRTDKVGKEKREKGWVVLDIQKKLHYNQVQPEIFLEHLFKAGVHMKGAFWLVIMVLTQISRSCLKQSRISMLIQHIYVLGRLVNFWVIFRCIWR